MASKEITLKIGKEEVLFKVETDDYNRYLNESSYTNKVTPAIKLLRRTLVDKSQSEIVEEACDSGHALDLTEVLLLDFRGELVIEVKK